MVNVGPGRLVEVGTDGIEVDVEGTELGGRGSRYHALAFADSSEDIGSGFGSPCWEFAGGDLGLLTLDPEVWVENGRD